MSTYSPILRTELIGDGQQPGAWGATTNSNFQYIFEAAIAGFVSVTVSPSSNNQVLTYTNGPSSNASLDQTVYGILKLNTGTLSANFNIFAPPVSKTYIVWNNTSYTATFYNSTVIGNTTAAGSGISIPAGAKIWVWSDGTNFWGNDTVAGNFSVSGNLSVSGTLGVTGVTTLSTLTLGTALSVANGGTGVTTSTGTGSVVLSTSPTLVTPNLGTPSTLVGTNITGTASALSIGGNAATATAATRITNSGGWNVTPSGTKLYFNYNGTNVGSLDSSGNFIVTGNVTAYGTA